MKEPKTLAEWLESQGNPKHSIAEDENGSKRDRIKNGKFPKGAWLQYTLDGKKIELDTKGRIPA
jgi:hypothetical protein